MSNELNSLTAKMDALREKGFSDEEINAILSTPASQAQPQAQNESINPDSVNVYQFLRSPPTPMAVTAGMSESDREYATEWNKRIDKLSFFFGWKADAIGFGIIMWLAWPILGFVIGTIATGSPKESFISFGFIVGWFVLWFVTLLVSMSYINQQYFLPHLQFLLKKRVS